MEDQVPVESALLKTCAIALSTGIGLGLVALAAIAYSMSPKGWDEKAISASFESADFELKPSPAAYFTYSLTNNTHKDFTTKLLGEKHLPDNLRAATVRSPMYETAVSTPKHMKPVLNFGAISFYTEDTTIDESYEQLASGEPLFVPAKQTVRVRLRWEMPADELTKYGSVKIVNTSLLGFVLYDDATKYQINFPKPALLRGTLTDLNVKNPTSIDGFAPDRGKPWEKYAACAEKDRLLPLCKNAKINLSYASAAAAGWMPVGPLTALPVPPVGTTLEPDEEICKTIYEWDFYCRRQMK
jgi:hypothetical protein